MTTPKGCILLAGFPPLRAARLRAILHRAGYLVAESNDARPAPEGDIDAALLEAHPPAGFAARIRRLREGDSLLPVVVLSERQLDEPALLELGRARARDVLVLEDLRHPEELLGRLADALAHGRRHRAGEQSDPLLVGRSARMQQVRRYIRQAARSCVNVLLLGETGTGKELAARAIHSASGRRDGSFVAVNCSAIAAGLLESELFGHERGAFTGADRLHRGAFELAHQGTLFLDELAEMPPPFQAKLLRVLSPPPGLPETTREFRRVGGEAVLRADVRILAATNTDLEAEVRARRFRNDLHERLNVLTIHLPPLRDRLDDVPALVESFLSRLGADGPRLKVDPAALRVLGSYRYPNNVRELESVLRQVVALKETGDTIVMGDLPHRLFERRRRPRDAPAPREGLPSLAEVERAHVEKVLGATGGQKAQAARILGISRPRLDRLLVIHRIQLPRRGSRDATAG